MKLGLEGKVVLVTGGSGSIGAAIATAYAAEGARTAVTYRGNPGRAQDVVDTITAQGGEAISVQYDLADRSSIIAAVDAVVEQWGQIDVLVMSASALEGTRMDEMPFEKIPLDEWQPVLRADVEGAFHTVQAVLPVMKGRGWGRIAIISANIVTKGATGDEAFVVSKMALHGLGRNLATELAAEGILVNTVAPGPTVSRGFLDRFPESVTKDFVGKSDAEIKQALNRGAPVGHVSTPADVANTVLFLTSAANGNVSGAVVHVAGGH
ncbi:SDR family NAD(P)-dependent oxidoreductase [Amycolatopsis sp. lyj-90]|uniref:SDR family NAD(P)-dependent oxidoreductase n=1 Tax=Amycolatopsis sp. lyj-90 TaxID=2789285 RepID=UPI0039797B10